MAVNVVALVVVVVATTLGVARPAAAEDTPVDRVEIRGIRRTQAGTVVSLLPREPPATYSDAELREFDRRVNNLGIFDHVLIRAEGRSAVVELREKWTLIPSLDFSTGQTLADTYAIVGLTEYNLLGRATALGGVVAWEERALSGYVSLHQQRFSPRTGALYAELYHFNASLRFDGGQSWYREQSGGTAGWQLPYSYGSPLRLRGRAYAYRERNHDVVGTVEAPSGVAIGGYLEASWDRYTWRDLAPSGYELALDLSLGALAPAREPRHEGLARLQLALAPTGTTALLGRAVAQAVSGGNVNHSVLLGSHGGVRGLADAFYRNRAQVVANLELRQAWRFAERWALQGALFGDGAVFWQMDAQGQTGAASWAAAAGAGARLIPTALAEVVLRIDGGRLLLPSPGWFAQVALGQYF